MTLEEAQEQILELQDQVTALTGERDTLSQVNTALTEKVEELRTLNQKLFLRTQAGTAEEPKNEEPAPASCEEFAKTIKLF